jgi:hypothetical protein
MSTQRDIAGNNDWLTVKEATGYRKMSRSRLYNMIADQAVRTVSIKRRGKTRGKRYVSKTSLDSYFDTMCESQMTR